MDMSIGSAEENTASNGQTEVLYVDNISSGTRNNNSSRTREARNKAIARRKEEERLAKKRFEKWRLDKLADKKRYEAKLEEKHLSETGADDGVSEEALARLFEDRRVG